MKKSIKPALWAAGTLAGVGGVTYGTWYGIGTYLRGSILSYYEDIKQEFAKSLGKMFGDPEHLQLTLISLFKSAPETLSFSGFPWKWRFQAPIDSQILKEGLSRYLNSYTQEEKGLTSALLCSFIQSISATAQLDFSWRSLLAPHPACLTGILQADLGLPFWGKESVFVSTQFDFKGNRIRKNKSYLRVGSENAPLMRISGWVKEAEPTLMSGYSLIEITPHLLEQIKARLSSFIPDFANLEPKLKACLPFKLDTRVITSYNKACPERVISHQDPCTAACFPAVVRLKGDIVLGTSKTPYVLEFTLDKPLPASPDGMPTLEIKASFEQDSFRQLCALLESEGKIPLRDALKALFEPQGSQAVFHFQGGPKPSLNKAPLGDKLSFLSHLFPGVNFKPEEGVKEVIRKIWPLFFKNPPPSQVKGPPSLPKEAPPHTEN